MTRAQFFQAVQAIVAVFDDPNIQPPDVQNIIDTVKIVLAQDKKTVNGGEDLMPSIATITGKIGPGTTLTSVVYNNVTLLSLDTFNEALTMNLIMVMESRKSLLMFLLKLLGH